MSQTIAGLFAARSADTARPFIIQPDGRVWTYAEAHAVSGQLANALMRCGVGRGDRVAAQVEKSVPALLLYLACLRAGAVYLPLNTAYTATEVAYFLSDARPALVVIPGDAGAVVASVAATDAAAVRTRTTIGIGSLIALADDQPSDFIDVPTTDDDLAALLYTSGTTGRSKGAMLTNRNLASNAMTLVDHWRFTERDVLLHALPIFHTHGLFVASNVTLAAGASMIFLPKFDPDAVFRHLPRATAMMGVPTFYTRLLDDARLTADATRHMRVFVSGSAPLLADTHRSWTARTGHAILERYGMTETNMITSNPYAGERVPGAVGPALPGVSVRIADAETGAILPVGTVGMIEVKGPNVFKGYWDMPEKTAAEFCPDGYFITGDLGLMDAEGTVTIVGRGKDLVISGGFNVYPKEVETELDQVAGVLESAVIGVPHRDFGEGVTAIVVGQPGATITEAGLVRALDGRLAKFKQPKRIIIVDSLPRNAMGKVLKAELRKTYADLYGAVS